MTPTNETTVLPPRATDFLADDELDPSSDPPCHSTALGLSALLEYVVGWSPKVTIESSADNPTRLHWGDCSRLSRLPRGSITAEVARTRTYILDKLRTGLEAQTLADLEDRLDEAEADGRVDDHCGEVPAALPH